MYGQMEGKFFATTKTNAKIWGSKLGTTRIVKIRVFKKSLLNQSVKFFNYKLDGIGLAYYFDNMEYLNSIIKLLKFL